MIDWRGLLSSIQIEWRDRGANWSRGNVNIRCPLCANDPSFHMRLNEEEPGFYCLRDGRHKGRNLVFLLGRMKIAQHEAQRLLQTYSSKKLNFAPAPPSPAPDLSKALMRWNRFQPAQDSPHCRAYLLAERGFPRPAVTCATYDLRYAPEGEWAQRILLPIRDTEGEVVSWVGRALSKQAELRYKMEDAARSLIYMPRRARRRLIVVEGPFDALKIAAATEAEDIAPMALLGKALNSTKLMLINRLAEEATEVFQCMDEEVPIGESYATLRELQAALRRPVRRLKLPLGSGDAGALDFAQVREWLCPLF
jgi:hypothetical protein